LIPANGFPNEGYAILHDTWLARHPLRSLEEVGHIGGSLVGAGGISKALLIVNKNGKEWLFRTLDAGRPCTGVLNP
jgi:hypothetical protein